MDHGGRPDPFVTQMCRLYGYLSELPTRVECGLVCAQNSMLSQSLNDHRGMSNPDGWGMAWFDGVRPRLKKRTLQAAADPQFRVTADEIRTRVLVAHVRLATVGGATLANVHPFACGRWAFAHNGTIPEIETVGPVLARETPDWLLQHRRGTTDSEQFFLWLLAKLELRQKGATRMDMSSTTVAQVVRDCIRDLISRCAQLGTSPPTLNFVLSDGRVLLAACYGRTLFTLQRETLGACDLCGTCHCPVCRARETSGLSSQSHDRNITCRAFVVASEAITAEQWVAVDDGVVLCVDDTFEVLRLAI